MRQNILSQYIFVWSYYSYPELPVLYLLVVLRLFSKDSVTCTLTSPNQIAAVVTNWLSIFASFERSTLAPLFFSFRLNSQNNNFTPNDNVTCHLLFLIVNRCFLKGNCLIVFFENLYNNFAIAHVFFAEREYISNKLLKTFRTKCPFSLASEPFAHKEFICYCHQCEMSTPRRPTSLAFFGNFSPI